jgi:predicted N-acyltransferase
LALVDRTARILHSISEISVNSWNRCANPDSGVPYDPFVSHEFLLALEESGSATARTGWQPFHLALEEGDRLLGVVPMYVKGHSQGEYVFDYSWADAWHRAGRDYYPKLQVSVPFTPATGRRLLTPEPDPELETQLLGACVQVSQQIDVSSLHMTFMPESQWQIAGELGYLKRMDQQYHWHNPGYSSFDDFLGDLSSKKRNTLRRERREALANGIEIEWVTGADLTEDHWDAFYRFYMDTGSRKWGSPYLTRQFFSQIGETLADHTLLILCRREGRYVATTRPSTSPLNGVSREWKLAPRGATRSPAATCHRLPTVRTGSTTQAFATPYAIISKTSGAMWPKTSTTPSR